MPEVVHVDQIDIAADPKAVYEHRLDFTQLPLINANVQNLTRTDGGEEPGVGATYAFDTVIEGMGSIPTTLTVTEADPAALRISNVMDAGIPARETVVIEPVAAGSRVRFEVTIELPEEGAADLEPLVREGTAANVRAELDGMKRLLGS